ncbi:hypothetical protein D3C80_877160 [compost metagenome]
MVPSFSNQPAAGSNKSANLAVSALCEMSCTTTNFAFDKAFSTRRESGKLTNGLVQIIQMAFIFPDSKASNISVAVNPGFSDTSSTPQNSATSLRCSGLFSSL